MRKRLSPLAETIKVEVVGLLGAAILKGLNATLRWYRSENARPERLCADDMPRIAAFWHGRQLMMPWLYLAPPGHTRRPVVTLISQHRDGRMIARAVSRLGIDSVAGSSSRGGKEAIFQLSNRIKQGCHIAITPDGPRGPAMKPKAGVIKIAQLTGAPILPVAFGAERHWRFKSWDSMILPKPFSRTVFVVGPPILVPSELSEEQVEAYCLHLEASLNEVTAKADSFVYD